MDYSVNITAGPDQMDYNPERCRDIKFYEPFTIDFMYGVGGVAYSIFTQNLSVFSNVGNFWFEDFIQTPNGNDTIYSLDIVYSSSISINLGGGNLFDPNR